MVCQNGAKAILPSFNSQDDGSMELDFNTGKLHRVAQADRGRHREYVLLATLLVLSSLPYVLMAMWNLAAAIWLLGFLAVIKTVMTFANSTISDTAHHVRFLLAGSNPIGMTGGASLMLGAVDSVFDWSEDAASRRQNAWLFWVVTTVKFLLTPVGAVLMIFEFAWDLILLRRRWRLIRFKWYEFFFLAQYHDIICPEKSNDIFYADMAFAKYQNNPHYYQWVRLRLLVFELQHYQIDVRQGIGVPQTNLFWQNELAAYQVMKRLQLENIERAVECYFDNHIDQFPLPTKLAQRLIRNAKPIAHYLRMRTELAANALVPTPVFLRGFQAIVDDLNQQFADSAKDDSSDRMSRLTLWHLFRLLDLDEADSPDYLSPTMRKKLRDANFLQEAENGCLQPSWEIQERIQLELRRHFIEASDDVARKVLLSRVPTVLSWQRRYFVPQESITN